MKHRAQDPSVIGAADSMVRSALHFKMGSSKRENFELNLKTIDWYGPEVSYSSDGL